MIHFHTGSHAHDIITLLSVVGEFPMHSIHLLGNERTYKAVIHKLTTVQTIRNPQTETEITCRALTISGKGIYKTIRLYKAVLPILTWISPNALDYYLYAFWNHKFPGDASHRERNHRIAEAVAMCMRTGMMFKPYELPMLQNASIQSVIPDSPVLYLAKHLKRAGDNDLKKTMFTRLVGAIYANGTCLAVYNTRNSVMKWSGMGEFKTLHSLNQVSRLNSHVSNVDSAILFGESEKVALATLESLMENRRLEFRFDSIYRHIYYVPMNEFGIRQLRLLLLSDRKKILDILFGGIHSAGSASTFEYDACIDGVYILSHLDGDIARLIRYKEGVAANRLSTEVLCFPQQVKLLKDYLGDLAQIKVIDMELLETELNHEEGWK